MKNFFKKLSFVMAIALVLTSLAPTGTASAATKIKMERSTKILYVGGSDVTGTKDTYDFDLDGKPENWKTDYKFVWESSNEDVATVEKGGVVTAVNTGKATITCTMTNKENAKEVQVATATVTVRANAKAVEIKADSYPEDKIAKIGEVIDFNRTLISKVDGVKSTDKTYWELSDNTAEATVDLSTGKVTAAKAGSYTITAYTYQSAGNKVDLDENGLVIENEKVTAKSEPVTITVVPSVIGAKQTTLKKAELVFDTPIEKDAVTKDSLKVYYLVGETKVLDWVKDVTVKDKVATVEMYNEFVADRIYVITYDGKDYEFKASKGDVVQAVISTVQAVIGKASDVNVKLYNAEGVDITSSDLLAKVTLTSDTTNTGWYLDSGNKKITFSKEGQTALVKATYRDYEYKDGKVTEKVVESLPVEILAVKSLTVAEQASVWTITTKDNAKDADWTNLQQNIAVGDSTDSYIVTKVDIITDGKAETIYSRPNVSDKFSFVSNNTNVLLVDNKTGKIIPVKEGNASIICKYENTVIGVFEVQVLAKRQPLTVYAELDSSVLSTAYADDKITATVTVKDQYGTVIKNAVIASVNPIDKTLTKYPAVSVAGNKVTFRVGNAEAGKSYGYEIKVGKAAAYVYFTVNAPTAGNEVTNYTLAVSKSEVDTKVVSGSAIAANKIEIEIFGNASNGVKVRKETFDTATGAALYCTIKNVDGTVVDKTKISVDNGTGILNPVIKTTKDNKLVIDKLPAGTYVISLFKGDDFITSAYFTVKDTQPAPEVSVKKTVSDLAGTAGVANIFNDCFTVKIGNTQYTLTDSDIKTTGVIGNYIHFESITVTETYEGATLTHTVQIGQTIQVK